MTTQKSGVMVPGTHGGGDIYFCGVLDNVMKLKFFGGKYVFRFKCVWFNIDPKKTCFQTIT